MIALRRLVKSGAEHVFTVAADADGQTVSKAKTLAALSNKRCEGCDYCRRVASSTDEVFHQRNGVLSLYEAVKRSDGFDAHA